MSDLSADCNATYRGVSRTIQFWGRVLSLAVVLLNCTVDLIAQDAKPDSESPSSNAKRLLALHLGDAEQYEIFRTSDRKDKLELQKAPVYVWTNPLRSGGQNGAVFVWTHQGRPEVVASIFSSPQDEKRQVLHELHSLSTEVLIPVREVSHNKWQPKSGMTLQPLTGAPEPAESARLRGIQLRTLSREFSAYSIDYNESKWELRLLPQPLFRYESTDPKVIDGALFTFVTSAGTDPEVMVMLEARRIPAGTQWQYMIARFSDHNVYVHHKDAEVWKSVRGGDNIWDHDPMHLYRLYIDRSVDEVVEPKP